MCATLNMTVVLVTGANRGIGFGIVRRLANEYASSALGQSGGPLTIYLGARTLSKGEEARSQLVSELPARAANIVPCTLDVASNESIAACAQQIGPVDVLINNAGISLEGFDADMVAQTLAVNYYAVKNVIKSVSLRDGGRIVNVASLAGTLHGLSPEIADRFLNAQTEHDVDTLMQEFQDAVKDAKCTERGWKQWAYGVSKTGLIAYTKVLAKTLKHQGSSTIVNACCPGCKWLQLDPSHPYMGVHADLVWAACSHKDRHDPKRRRSHHRRGSQYSRLPGSARLWPSLGGVLVRTQDLAVDGGAPAASACSRDAEQARRVAGMFGIQVQYK